MIVVWFGCDVSKFLHRPSGLMDVELFDYDLTFGVQLNLNKADRLRYGESAMTHAMTITGVDLENKDGNEKPIKWRIENSWGDESGDKGYLCMMDGWFDEFTYQVVIQKDELEKNILDILEQTPATLPPWVKNFVTFNLFMMGLIFYGFRIQWGH